MKHRDTSSEVADALSERRPHLVVKRGHHGRYRFVLLNGSERIAGEVRVPTGTLDSVNSRAMALAQIANLSKALIARVTPHMSADTAGAEGVVVNELETAEGEV